LKLEWFVRKNQQGHMMISDFEMTWEKFRLDSIQHHFIHPPPLAPQRVHRRVHDAFISISTTTTTTTSLLSHQHLNDDNGDSLARRICSGMFYIFLNSTNDYLQLLVRPPLPPLLVTITPNTIVTVSGHYHHHQRCPNSCHWSTNDVDHYHTTTSTSQRMTTANIVMGQHRTIANTSQQGPTQDIEAEGARDASRLAPWYVFLFYLLINIHLD
jgi:hypothetical protein